MDYDVKTEQDIEWANLSPDGKKLALFHKQRVLLEQFLERNAISRQQYEKSLGDLIEKMGIPQDEVCPK